MKRIGALMLAVILIFGLAACGGKADVDGLASEDHLSHNIEDVDPDQSTGGAATGLGTALGEAFLPMHLPILLVGLLAGPYAGAVSGFLSPLLSFALSGMPRAAMLPFMMIELCVYGLATGLLRNVKMPTIGKVVAAQVAVRAVRAAAILLSVYAFGNSQIAVATIWTSIAAGLFGLVLQWAFLPLIVYRIVNAIRLQCVLRGTTSAPALSHGLTIRQYALNRASCGTRTAFSCKIFDPSRSGFFRPARKRTQEYCRISRTMTQTADKSVRLGRIVI